MMTSSNGNFFCITGPLCGEFTGHGEFPAQRPVTWSFDVFFDLRLNKRLSKQSAGWWFGTPSCPLWRQCNEYNKAAQHLQPACWVVLSVFSFDRLQYYYIVGYLRRRNCPYQRNPRFTDPRPFVNNVCMMAILERDIRNMIQGILVESSCISLVVANGTTTSATIVMT